MTETNSGAAAGAVTYPTARRAPFDPPEELGRFREETPIRRMAYPDGHLGWLVTGYAAARAILADPRFSARSALMHPPLPQMLTQQQTLRVLPGFFLRTDAPEHTRFRRLLTGQFTVRRMKGLEPRIEKITSDLLDIMEAQGSPLDLVRAFALPIPSLVICELLGVPYSDRERFQRDSSALLSLAVSQREKLAAFTDLTNYLGDLVLHKRAKPADDLLSGLVTGGELTDEELAGVGFLLLVAGHETTANMIGLGTFALLTNPSQLAQVRDDPTVIESAVEELLRYLTIIHIGPTRSALEDVEIEGQTIKAGESVTLSLAAANRDPDRFDSPATLDVTRSATGHLTFGHGIHQCLGQQLARVEMRIAYPALLRRFPHLRLAVAPEEVPMRTDMTIYGVHRLPVTW